MRCADFRLGKDGISRPSPQDLIAASPTQMSNLKSSQVTDGGLRRPFGGCCHNRDEGTVRVDQSKIPQFSR